MKYPKKSFFLSVSSVEKKKTGKKKKKKKKNEKKLTKICLIFSFKFLYGFVMFLLLT